MQGQVRWTVGQDVLVRIQCDDRVAYQAQDISCGLVLIGPGDYRVAHTLNEYIELDEILPALKLYALATMDRLGYD